MATIRRAGFGSVFEVENETVGIGTTGTATNTVQVLGETKASLALVTGLSTLTTYQGFVDSNAEFGNSNVDINSQSGTMGNIEICHGDFNVSSASTLTSSVNQLTLTDSFSVPTGNTDSRIHCQTAGSMRFNEDLGTLEFYTGDEWRTVNSFKDTGNRGRAVFMIGVTSNDFLDFVNISSLGNARNFGSLSDARRTAFGCASSTRGLWGAGQSTSPTATQDVIDYITIASEGDAIDYGNLTAATSEPCATSSSTRGIWAGGYAPTPSPSRTNIIQYVEIATLGNALDFGDLTVVQTSQAAAASPTRAIFSGGYSAPHQYEMVSIASKGNSVRFGDMAAVRARHDGCSNGTRGVFGGGRSGGGFQIEGRLEYITIASEGNGIEFGTLSKIDRNMLASASNKTRGLFAGGYDPATSPTNSNVIDFITFSSLGNAQDFGDLVKEKRGVSGLSDSHGGLGGF